MTEYAFDVKLYAVVRVKADSLDKARHALRCVLDCADLSEHTIAGINSGLAEDGVESVIVTEASLAIGEESDYPDRIEPFEIDGKHQPGM